ncbi:unnamed protein product [Mucor hiemalis]
MTTNQPPEGSSQTPFLTDEQIITEHIPHFLNVLRNRRRSLTSQSQRQDQPDVDHTTLEFVSENGDISEKFIDQDTTTKDKAYQEIQEARGYNTSVTYCSKQVEFLRFCGARYARKPSMVRYQATSDKLLAFLYKKVFNRTVRKPGEKYIDKPENEIDNNDEEELVDQIIHVNTASQKRVVLQHLQCVRLCSCGSMELPATYGQQ